MDPSKKAEYIRALRAAWRIENASQRIYANLAEKETNPARRKVLFKLAEAERVHGEQWDQILTGLGAPPGKYQETLRERMWRWTLVQSGTDNALKRIESAEDEDAQMYEILAKMAPNESDRQALEAVRVEEAQHSGAARKATAEPAPLTPQMRLEIMIKREHWHKRGGGWIGQAIYGANDGLGAVFGIVSGVAGATAGGSAVLVAGMAGMIASALSMGSGAFLATKAEREVYEAEVKRERREMEEHPEEEREELELFYQLKGIPEETARLMAAHIFENREEALRTLTSEELGLSEQSFPNPWREAFTAAISTALGAFIPIIPFFFASGYPAVIASFAISTLAHFAIGAAKTIVTGLNPIRSGLEMTLVGLGEAAITYSLGLLLGKSAGL
jgi:vacuolar iron transporter family protein